jgi:hypothetical protein
MLHHATGVHHDPEGAAQEDVRGLSGVLSPLDRVVGGVPVIGSRPDRNSPGLGGGGNKIGEFDLLCYEANQPRSQPA